MGGLVTRRACGRSFYFAKLARQIVQMKRKVRDSGRRVIVIKDEKKESNWRRGGRREGGKEGRREGGKEKGAGAGSREGEESADTDNYRRREQPLSNVAPPLLQHVSCWCAGCVQHHQH